MAGGDQQSGAAPTRGGLDGLAARGAALLVLLLVVAGIGWLHRDNLFPAEQAATPAADDPVARCLAERAKGIDDMQAQGTIDAGQATLFKSRAEALCQAQHGQSGPPAPQ